MEKESSEVKEVKEGRAPTALMLQDVISLVFSQLTLSARDICILRRICTTWRKIIHASTKRISFDRGAKIYPDLLQTLSQFSSLFLDLSFTRFQMMKGNMWSDVKFGEELIKMDGLIGLDLSRVSGQEDLCGYPLNLRVLRGAMYPGTSDRTITVPHFGQTRRLTPFKSLTHSILHLTRLQELILGRIVRDEGDFVSSLTTLHTLGIGRNEGNDYDLTAMQHLTQLRTLKCALDPRTLNNAMVMNLPHLQHLEANFDWRNCKDACLPLLQDARPVNPHKLSFPLDSYALQSFSVCPYVLFPAPSDCVPNPFAVLTSLTSLSFQFPAVQAWMLDHLDNYYIPDICTSLAPLQRLETFRLYYTKNSLITLFTLWSEQRVTAIQVRRHFIPKEIVMNNFVHLHTLCMQFQPASIIPALSHCVQLTKLSLTMVLHSFTSQIHKELEPLGRLVSLRTLKLIGLYVEDAMWTWDRLRRPFNDEHYRNIPYDFLIALTNLRHLDLSGRGVTDVGFASIAKMPQLVRLRLHFSNLSEVSIKLFEDDSFLPCLREMRFDGSSDWWSICKRRGLPYL